MHVYIYTNRKITAYERKLKKLGFTYEVEQLPDAPLWNGDYLAPVWLETITRQLFERRGESVDMVQFILDDWNGRPNNLGHYYGYTFNGYRVSIVRDRKGYEKTAEHELLHAVNDLVALYTGLSLSSIYGVSDFDSDVVHGEHPDYREYEYDEVWERLMPYLRVAVQKRKRMGYRSALERLVVALKEMVERLRNQIEEIDGITHPVAGFAVTQAYGVKNPRYPRTGIHIGTDYACPTGTPIYAPKDGHIVAVGWSEVLGNFCHYRYQHEGTAYTARFPHLSAVPEVGTYGAGTVIAVSGDTGDVTAPHCHIDVWYGDVRVDLITKTNWSKLTIDPEKHYA